VTNIGKVRRLLEKKSVDLKVGLNSWLVVEIKLMPYMEAKARRWKKLGRTTRGGSIYLGQEEDGLTSKQGAY
jgi:hypothetical protein